MLEDITPILVALGALLSLIAIRVPVGLSLIAVSFVGITYEISLRAAIGSLARIPYDLASNWSFSAIPMFLLMGYVASETGLTSGLFRASRQVLARLPGALACSSVLASALFAAASGSSVATASAMSKIAIPEMLSRRYDPGLACGTIAASGTLGSLIPPSIVMILYGVYSDVSIGALFMAGILPGILSMAIYIAMIVTRCKLNPSLAGGGAKAEDEPTVGAGQLLMDIAPLPILIAIVMGSISMGWATPTEAGALGAFGAVLIAIAMRTFSPASFWSALKQSALSFAAIFVIIIGGALLTRYVAVAGLNKVLEQLFVESAAGPLMLIAAVSVLYIVLGMFIDSIGLLLLTAPLVLPLAVSLEMDMIWFGIILIKLLEIGLITPPVGLNIFVIKSALGDQVTLPTIFKGVTWFISMDVLTLVLLVAFPAITIWLPEMIYG